MDEGTRQTIITIALVAAAIGPVLIVIGKVISSVGTIMTLVPKIVSLVSTVKTGLTALFTVMSANPITIVIAAIAALVAAFIYLWNNCEEFREFWINLWEAIKEAAETAWEAISTVITTVVTAIQTFLTTAWNTISGIQSCIGSLVSAVSSIASTIASYLHFSVPEEGPLSEYESWMPDFMEGLAKGIEEGRGMIYTLLAFVAADYITGVMCAVYDKELSSEVGFTGICRKVLIFLIVGLANFLDVNVVGWNADSGDESKWEAFKAGLTGSATASDAASSAADGSAGTTTALSAASASGTSSGTGMTNDDCPFLVKVTTAHLNIRTGPGTNYSKTGKYTGVGTFTITKVSSGTGSTAGWGCLKSGAGWISLDYVVKV